MDWPRRHTLVYGGANTGLMERLANSAHEAGAMVIGVVPQILKRVGERPNSSMLRYPATTFPTART